MRAIAICVIAGCASRHPRPAPDLSYTEHVAEAREAEAAAEAHDDALLGEPAVPSTITESYQCGDDVIHMQSTSGGEPVSRWVPCWAADTPARDRHRAEAARARQVARAHRAAAADLVADERAKCKLVDDDELAHTPLSHAGAIATVEPLRDGSTVVGARIRMKRVPGMTAGWLRSTIACHQARAALHGFDDYMAYDPTVIPHVRVTVADDRGGPVIAIRARGADVGEVLARARALAR